jgi:metal-responsive CopG/Arc/MetJ family transcriptional regulator
MVAKAVQISIDSELLRRIDSDAETKRIGRSAFVRAALSTYLRAKERREVDDSIRRAYEGHSDELLADVEELMRAQAWPKK